MKATIFIFPILTLLTFVKVSTQESRFDKSKDLLLMQFDCKTDIDDLHSVAALRTLLNHTDYNGIQFHAVAGAYGIQKGLYVPPEELFELAFEDANWSDAHNDIQKALNEVLKKVNKVIFNGGDIWIADAGQSDFSAKWIKALVAMQPRLNVKERIHLVQHSDWNEEVTSPELLAYVKTTTDYHKIPDGNAVGNGTPGFRSDEKINWEDYLKSHSDLKKVWQFAISLGNTYNGKEGRYLNTSVAAGGLDFSDLSEVCYVLGIETIKDAHAFFDMVTNK